MDLLSSTDGLLKIEDILPFFNDFTLIDDFKVLPIFFEKDFDPVFSFYKSKKFVLH